MQRAIRATITPVRGCGKGCLTAHTYWSFDDAHYRVAASAKLPVCARHRLRIPMIRNIFPLKNILCHFVSSKLTFTMHENGRSSMSEEYDYVENPSKRRRISSGQDFSNDSGPPLPSSTFPKIQVARGYENPAIHFHEASREDQAEEEKSITISASSKQATQTVAPFLARHIPQQYAPMGGLDHSDDSTNKDVNTKYCYRHRPDLKCRRQVNEPSMDQLQHVGISYLSLPFSLLTTC